MLTHFLITDRNLEHYDLKPLFAKIKIRKVYWLFEIGHLFLSIFEKPNHFWEFENTSFFFSGKWLFSICLLVFA